MVAVRLVVLGQQRTQCQLDLTEVLVDLVPVFALLLLLAAVAAVAEPVVRITAETAATVLRGRVNSTAQAEGRLVLAGLVTLLGPMPLRLRCSTRQSRRGSNWGAAIIL